MNKAIFLDRDGTINKDSIDYIKSVEEFFVFPYAGKALEIFRDLKYKLFIVTNQSGVGRGYLSLQELDKIHNSMENYFLENHNIAFSEIAYCPHLPDDNCDCRKPKTKNLNILREKHDIDFTKSWFIGDSKKDILTGKNLNCKTALVLSGVRGISERDIEKWNMQPDLIAENLFEAAKKIRKFERSGL